jgi:tetratricopeptide (TPR) repeat protein
MRFIRSCATISQRRVVPIVAAGCAAALPAAARADFVPPPAEVVLPDEQALFAEMTAEATSGKVQSEESLLALFDRALLRLPRPTKLRGIVQLSRVSALLAQSRHAEAVEAVEESIRLLPDSSGPLILASRAYAYSEQPERAADFLLRASRKDPQEVRRVDDYEVFNLTRRLWIKGDDRRAAEIAATLLGIGWTGSKVSSRSSLALAAIEAKIRGSDVEGARPFIPKLVVPDHSRTLLISNDNKALWNGIEEWAGPRLARQWTIYLTEARERWLASKDNQVLGDYLTALDAAGHDDTIIKEILPLFDKKLHKERDYELMFLASAAVRPLARKGRWDDVHRLYANMEAIWPLGSDANALNLFANHAKWLLYEGHPQYAVEQFDRVIADARKRTPEVDSFALASMYLNRACALYELGRASEAATAAPMVLATGKPTTIAGYYVCANDLDRARAILIQGLSDPQKRSDVLSYVQPSDDRDIPTAYSRKIFARYDALRADPQLLAAVSNYGRILPWKLSEGAPPEQ